jgi:hypothetical protein
MLKSSALSLAGAALMSVVLNAQSSQPSGNQSSPKQQAPAPVQPPQQHVSPPGIGTEPLKNRPLEQKQPRFKIIVVPRREPKAFPIGILDKATAA